MSHVHCVINASGIEYDSSKIFKVRTIVTPDLPLGLHKSYFGRCFSAYQLPYQLYWFHRILDDKIAIIYALLNRSDSIQNSLNWLHGKTIRIIYSYDSDFIFVACKEYDRDIDVMSSKGDFNSFKISIPRRVEPGVIKCFDIWQDVPMKKRCVHGK